MCLISKTCVASIANEDIECYKVLFKRGRNKARTAYQAHCLDSKIIKGKRDFVETESEEYFNIGPRYSIGKGYIHTFKTIEGAIEDANYHSLFNFYSNKNVLVYKCIIPKGTSYLEGNFNRDAAYASKRIRFIEEVYKI